MECSVIIVSWNVRTLLAGCLRSLEAEMAEPDAPTMEVIVVDSASSDGTPQMVREQFGWVRLLALEENVGFTRGNNIGMEAAAGRALFLLNPDTLVKPGCIRALLSTLAAHPDVAAAAPLLRNEDGSIQPSRRRLPSKLTALFESTWLQPVAPRRLLTHYYMADQPTDRQHEVDWVQGAALMVRREAINEVGMMDERFFMYSEELDWQHRMRSAGWRVLFVPRAEVVHFGGKSSEQVKAQRDIYFHSSKIAYFDKHHGAAFASFLRVFLLGNYLWQIGVEGVKAALGHKRAMRYERITAYWQVVRSGLRG